jgi:crotonobetainyl-CoA:carnitine CoA-transferase CaiB-like acyl-CoA transferase
MVGSGLLDGVRVLDLSIWRPGPYATQLLAEAGADVLKVEPPGGDPMRQYPGLFARLHVNKRSVVLDLKSDAGRNRVLELAADADVAVEGFRPGVVDRLGVGYEALRGVNPRIIYCSVSGMGQFGPLSAVPGHDVNYQAWAGMLAPTGGAPVEQSVPLADLAGGLTAAFAISAALVRRLSAGEGERIDVSMSDVLATWTGVTSPDGGTPDTAETSSVRNAGQAVPGYGTFETADHRFVSLGVVSEDHFWSSLCDALKLEDLRGIGFTDRVSRGKELQSVVAEAIAGREFDELVPALLEGGVPAAPVLKRAEMAELPHFRERAAVLPGPMVGHPVHFGVHPARHITPAPELDQHAGEGFPPRS